MPSAAKTKRERLFDLVSVLNADQFRPTERDDGVSETVRVSDTDDVCIVAAGEDTAVITIVTNTLRGRRLLRDIARSYNIASSRGQ